MFNPAANFRHGDPLMVDHTPVAFVGAGSVVPFVNGVRIAHVDIPPNVLGALAIGFGVYLVPKATAAGSGLPADTAVFWDTVNQVATPTASASTKNLGITTGVSLDADDHLLVLHMPA